MPSAASRCTHSLLEQESAPVFLAQIRLAHPASADRLDALGDAVGRRTDAYIGSVLRQYRRLVLCIVDGDRSEDRPAGRLLPKKSGSHRDGRGHR